MLIDEMRQVFHSDILNLLSMSDMWRSRAPPLPLDFDAIKNGTFVLKEPPSHDATQVNGKTNGAASGSKQVEKMLNGASTEGGGLKDQRSLTLGDNLALFISRYVF